jgi:hypothetical protein
MHRIIRPHHTSHILDLKIRSRASLLQPVLLCTCVFCMQHCADTRESFVLQLTSLDAGQASRPPSYYVCSRCQQGGHLKKDCPTNGDPSFDIKKISLGIPISRTRLLKDQSGLTGGDGVMRLLDGRLVLTVPAE